MYIGVRISGKLNVDFGRHMRALSMKIHKINDDNQLMVHKPVDGRNVYYLATNSTIFIHIHIDIYIYVLSMMTQKSPPSEKGFTFYVYSIPSVLHS